MEKFYRLLIYAVLGMFVGIPRSVLAASGPGNLSGLVTSIQSIINALFPVLASLALLGFFWGLVKYVYKAGNEEARKEAKQVIIAGIVALFLMASIGGIVNYLVGEFNFNDTTIPTPELDVSPPGP